MLQICEHYTIALLHCQREGPNIRGGFILICPVHLHCHSTYSFLDGATDIERLVGLASSYDMPALGLTDHNGVYGAVEFQKRMEGAGMRPVLGAEVVLEGGQHLVLIALNRNGYANLCRVLTDGFSTSERRDPRVNKRSLFEHSQDIVVLSGCERGELVGLIRRGNHSSALATAREYLDVFGGDRFYIELVNPTLPIARSVNPMLSELAGKLRLRLIATNDVHYGTKSEFRIHDVLTCIRTLTRLDDINAERHINAENYLKAPDEMRLAFEEYPEALESAALVAEMCDPVFDFSKKLLPRFPVPEGMTPYGLLRELTYAGARLRYKRIDAQVRERLESELSVIHQLGFEDYFLMVWDVARFAREHSIRYAGRGSAADSAVAYCLFITSVDSIARGLLFERFLSLERAQVPDIDIDFDARRRDDIINYVYEKHGHDHAAMVCTYNTFRTRSAIREVAKAFGFPQKEIDLLAKKFPFLGSSNIESALEKYPELRKGNIPLDRYRQLFEVCQTVDGFPRFIGTHLGGMIISGEPLLNITPLQKSAKGVMVTQFDKDYVEELGLIKLDLLCLRTLSAVEDSIDLIREKDSSFNYDAIPHGDKPTYEMLNKGETIGVFQLESPAQRALQTRLQADNIEDIVASVALIRPGPIEGNMVEPYIARRLGKDTVSFLHPKLKPILEKTYGVVLFQEQVIQIATAIAGFTPGESDRLRRVMTHKRSRKDMNDIGKEFVKRAVGNGVEEEIASTIFSYIQGYAGYGFCEAHSAAFADIAYKTAYLIRHYPAQFYAAILSNQPMGYYSPATIAVEAKRRGVSVLPVDINLSQKKFTVEGHSAIRASLMIVKGMTENAADSIVNSRKRRRFVSLQDFCLRTEIESNIVENLALCGAFDSLHSNRRQLVWDVPQILEACGRWKEEFGPLASVNGNIDGLLGDYMQTIPSAAEEQIQDFDPVEKLKLEFSIIHMNTGSHLMQFYRPFMKAQRILSTKEAAAMTDGSRVRVAGIVVRPHRPPTRSGRTVVFLSLEDEFGLMDVTVFERVYQEYGAIIYGEPALVVTGRIQRRGSGTSVIANAVVALPPFKQIEREAACTRQRSYRPSFGH